MREKGKDAWRMEESDVACRDGWNVIRLDLEARRDRRVVRLHMELAVSCGGGRGPHLVEDPVF